MPSDNAAYNKFFNEISKIWDDNIFSVDNYFPFDRYLQKLYDTNCKNIEFINLCYGILAATDNNVKATTNKKTTKKSPVVSSKSKAVKTIKKTVKTAAKPVKSAKPVKIVKAIKAEPVSKIKSNKIDVKAKISSENKVVKLKQKTTKIKKAK